MIGPRAVGTFLHSYARLPLPTGSSSSGARPRLHFNFESCSSLNSPRCASRDWLLRRSGLGLRTIRCVPVTHCADAWGVVLEHSHGWSVVYSGDTRPCEALVAAGLGATLLIHEATFDDARAADAVQKRHSTRSEALDVARRMRAHRTILTHLSARYREMHETRAEGSKDAAAATEAAAGDGNDALMEVAQAEATHKCCSRLI